MHLPESGYPSDDGHLGSAGQDPVSATFYQSHEGRSYKAEIPFDVTLDVVPQLLRDPDAHLQHLAAKSPKEVEGFEDIIGDSKSIRFAVGHAKRASVRDVPVSYPWRKRNRQGDVCQGHTRS